MKRIILGAFLLFIPLMMSATGYAKENKTRASSILFMNKKITFGESSESIKKLFSLKQVDPYDDEEKKYTKIYVYEINPIENLRFRFRSNRLVSLGIDSNSTGGPKNEISDFEIWVEKMYGKGTRLKSDSENIELTKWNVPGHKIIRRFYFNPESGDSLTGFEITPR